MPNPTGKIPTHSTDGSLWPCLLVSGVPAAQNPCSIPTSLGPVPFCASPKLTSLASTNPRCSSFHHRTRVRLFCLPSSRAVPGYTFIRPRQDGISDPTCLQDESSTSLVCGDSSSHTSTARAFFNLRPRVLLLVTVLLRDAQRIDSISTSLNLLRCHHSILLRNQNIPFRHFSTRSNSPPYSLPTERVALLPHTTTSAAAPSAVPSNSEASDSHAALASSE